MDGLLIMDKLFIFLHVLICVFLCFLGFRCPSDLSIFIVYFMFLVLCMSCTFFIVFFSVLFKCLCFLLLREVPREKDILMKYGNTI